MRFQENTKVIKRPVLLALMLAGFSCVSFAPTLSATNTNAPNFLFIQSDQFRYDLMQSVQEEMARYNGKTHIRTPNLDRLRREGVYFRRAYTQCAVCAPARSTFRTGCTLERHGGQSNDLAAKSTYDLDAQFKTKIEADVTLEQILVENRGYVAEHYGKWHMPEIFNWSTSGSTRIMQYNDFDFVSNTPLFSSSSSLNYGSKLASLSAGLDSTQYPGMQKNTYSKYPYVTDRIDKRYGLAPYSTLSVGQPDQQGRDTLPANRTPNYFDGTASLAALERLAGGAKPFVLTTSFHNPHAPMIATGVYYDYYKALETNMWLPPNFSGSDMGNSAWSKEGDPDYQDPAKIKEWMVSYYALCEEVDHYVGLLLDKLDEKGIASNTFVIFVSDHGEMLGAHGMREKNVFLEESAHVPMLMRFPGRIAAGTTVEETVATLDCFATTLDYLGASSYDHGDGRSLRRFIEKKNYNQDFDDEAIVTEWDFRDPDGSGHLTRTLGGESNFMCKKGPWKLILTKKASSTRLDMMYNLDADPFETNNYVGNNGMSASDVAIGKAEHLKRLLIEWMQRMDGTNHLYSDPVYNAGEGMGDIAEITARRKWKTLNLWVSDTTVTVGQPVNLAGQLTRNEYIYLGRTTAGTLNVSGISVQGADAGFFQLSEFTSGIITNGGYKRVKLTWRPTDSGQRINDARVVIKSDAGPDRVIELSSLLFTNSESAPGATVVDIALGSLDGDVFPARPLNSNTSTRVAYDWSASSVLFNGAAQSTRFYGGVSVSAVGGLTTFPPNIRLASASDLITADAVNGVTGPSEIRALYLWDAADFLASGANRFDGTTNSSFTMKGGTMFDLAAAGGTRFVIRDGNTYYVCNLTGLNATTTGESVSLSGAAPGLQWAAFDPVNFAAFTEDNANLGFGSVTFSARTFTNVTGVGFIGNTRRSSFTRFEVAQFKVNLVQNPVPLSSQPAFDVNRDGFDDLVNVTETGDICSVEMLLSDGSKFTNFSLAGSVTNHPSQDKWFTGDFDGNGAMDLARLWGGSDDSAYCEVTTNLQGGSLSLAPWASALGGYSASQRWFRGDFDGDGKDDLLEIPYDGTTLSLNVYRSTGSGFVRSTWWSSANARAETDWFFVSDVTGDGAVDLVRVYSSGGTVACRVYSCVSGTSFSQADWNPTGYAYVPDARWYPGDFNGDGRMDFTVLRSESGQAGVDVLLSTGSGFTVQTNWITGGAYTYGEETWYPGDFDGDGKTDLVKIHGVNGLFHADVYRATGTGFTPAVWVAGQGEYPDSANVLLCDFDGDNRQDLICLKRSGYQSVVDVYRSTGTAFTRLPVAYSQLPRFGSLRGLPSIRAHKYFDPHCIIGPLAPDGGDYNSVCRSGQDVYLKKGVEYVHTDASTSAFGAYAHQQVFETFEAKTLAEFATLVRGSLSNHTLLKLQNFSSTLAQQIIGDGRRYDTSVANVTAGFVNGGAHFAGGLNASYQRFNRIYAFNSVAQSALKIQEADAAHRNVHRGNRIENCLVFGAGVDARGSGRNPNVLAGWADAIGLTARETVIRNNVVMDGTDVGIVLFTAPDSVVEGNVVAAISRAGLGGINLLDTLFYSEWGIGGADAQGRLQFNFSTLVQSNYLDARGARIDVGIPVGKRTWSPPPDITTNNPYGINLFNNTLDGKAFGYGIAVGNGFGITATGNVSHATHSGQGGYFAIPNLKADPASAFAYAPLETFGCNYGSEFSPASADHGLDFLLFNTKNGRTATVDGYLYVAYTPAEAVGTVETAFLEMLHRLPTVAELAIHTNTLITVTNRADDLRVELMNLPEFDSVNAWFTGAKTVNGMQQYRAALWLANLKAIDAVGYNTGGNYPAAKALYQQALAYLNGDQLAAGSIRITPAAGGLTVQYEGALMTSTNLRSGWELASPQPGSPAMIVPNEPQRFFKALSP
ncbi:MAG: sulfatase-like hydrolase/transferase [Verrucomicrobiota bacterium]